MAGIESELLAPAAPLGGPVSSGVDVPEAPLSHRLSASAARKPSDDGRFFIRLIGVEDADCTATSDGGVAE